MSDNINTPWAQKWWKPGENIGAMPERVIAERDALAAKVDRWQRLYRRAINEANGLTNYVEDRPELRRAEKNIAAIEQEARTA